MIQQSRRLLQMLLIASTTFFVVFYYVNCTGQYAVSVTTRMREKHAIDRVVRKIEERSVDDVSSATTIKPFEDFLDLSKCPPNRPLSVFLSIKGSESPENEKMREALLSSGYVTKKERGACITIDIDGSSKAANNTVTLNSRNMNAIRVGASLKNYLIGIDIIGFPNAEVSPWLHPGPFLGKRKHRLCAVRSETEEAQKPNSTMKSFTLAAGVRKLKGCTSIFIPNTSEFEKSLRAVLVVGAIPVLLERSRESLPFRELVEPDDYAIFARDFECINLKISRISPNQEFELRRNGRILLDRYLRESKGFVRGIIETMSKRLSLPLHFPSPIIQPIVTKDTEKFTAVILTFKRLETLKLIIAVFQQIEDVVDKIVIVWNDVNSALPEKDTILSKIELQFIRPKRNSLNNRFLPWHKISTDCVLSVDDDIAVDKDNLLLGFRTWQSERDRIVSFAPRRREVDERGKPEYSLEKHERHELGLTGYAFLHRNYLYEYFTSMPAAFRNYVDAHRNCEDIAMNYLVAHLSRRSIVTVAFGGSLDMVKNLTGLSSRNNHQQVRTECVRFFEAAYGYNPLLSSYYQAAAHDILAKTKH